MTLQRELKGLKEEGGGGSRALEEERESLKKDLAAAVSSFSATQASLKTVEGERDSALVTVSQLKGKVEALEAAAAARVAQEGDAAELKERVGGLEKERASLQASLDEANEKLSEVEREKLVAVKELEGRIGELQGRLKTSEKESVELKARCEDLFGEKEELAAKVEGSLKRIREVEAGAEKLGKEEGDAAESLRRELEAERSRVESLRSEVDVQKARVEMLVEDKASLGDAKVKAEEEAVAAKRRELEAEQRAKVVVSSRPVTVTIFLPSPILSCHLASLFVCTYVYKYIYMYISLFVSSRVSFLGLPPWRSTF